MRNLARIGGSLVFTRRRRLRRDRSRFAHPWSFTHHGRRRTL